MLFKYNLFTNRYFEKKLSLAYCFYGSILFLFLVVVLLYQTSVTVPNIDGRPTLRETGNLHFAETIVRALTREEGYLVYLPLATRPHEWQPVGQPPEEGEKFFSIAICDEHVFGGVEQGAYSFQDGSWQNIPSIPSHTVYGITFPPETCNVAYLTVRGEGLWRGHVHDHAWEWARVDNGEVGSALTVVIQEEVLYVGGDFGLKWSDDQGSSWKTAFSDPIIRLSMNPYTQDLLAAVWNVGVYYQDSFDRAKWHLLGAISDPLVYQAANNDAGAVAGTQNGLFSWNGTQWVPAPDFTQTTFTVAATNEALYAGQRNTGVLISRDNGMEWQLFNNGLTMPSGEEFQVRDIHVGRDGYLYIATTNGVWQWSDPVVID